MNDSFYEVEELEIEGRSPFGSWFNDLDAIAAAKVTVAITRLQTGNHSNVKYIGSGVAEYKIDFGPGYRIYCETQISKTKWIEICKPNNPAQRRV